MCHKLQMQISKLPRFLSTPGIRAASGRVLHRDFSWNIQAGCLILDLSKGWFEANNMRHLHHKVNWMDMHQSMYVWVWRSDAFREICSLEVCFLFFWTLFMWIKTFVPKRFDIHWVRDGNCFKCIQMHWKKNPLASCVWSHFLDSKAYAMAFDDIKVFEEAGHQRVWHLSDPRERRDNKVTSRIFFPKTFGEHADPQRWAKENRIEFDRDCLRLHMMNIFRNQAQQGWQQLDETLLVFFHLTQFAIEIAELLAIAGFCLRCCDSRLLW